MTAARRNIFIIALVAGLLIASLLIIVPGSPISKPTRLGLDLKGGVELVYEGRATPKEPEIQRAGANQISIGLPAVQNAERAEQQVGTTAQLQFYDWEPNIFGDPSKGGGATANTTPFNGLFPAAEFASKQKPR